MKAVEFGSIGVSLEGFTKESLYDYLKLQHLAELLDGKFFRESKKFDPSMYLQSGRHGPYTENTTINIHTGFVHYVTDMDTFLLILRTGILSPDAANGLVEELYSQGLIKPRNYHV